MNRGLLTGVRLLAALLGAALFVPGACGQEVAAPTPERSRLGINLNGPTDWNSELPFVDVFRLSRAWISQREGAGWGKGPELRRDANGWATTIEPGCWIDTPLCTIEGGRFPQGQYVCLYEGQGKIEFWGSFGRLVEQQPGRIVFETKPGTSPIWLRIRAVDPTDYVRNIRVIMPGFEATYQQEPFHPLFLKRWRGFSTIRFMDWMVTNHGDPGRWESRPTPQYCNYTERGVPVEVMVDLCNRLGANPWFCMPHRADDDYVRRFAHCVMQKLNPDLKVYLEYSNEVWNSIFPQNRYAREKGQELGLGPTERPWEGGGMYYSRRSVEMFDIWEQVFGERSRLVRVLAWQAVNAWWLEHIILPAGEAAKHADAVAIAPYMGFLVPPQSTDKQVGADKVQDWTVDQVLDYTEQTALPASIKAMQEHKRVADKFGLKLVCYEAGQHLVGIGAATSNDRLTALFVAANRHPRMGQIYTRYLDAWKAIDGDLMCLFSSVGLWGRWGSWGLAQFYDETEADQPKLKAVMDWHHANPR